MGICNQYVVEQIDRIGAVEPLLSFRIAPSALVTYRYAAFFPIDS